MYSQSQSLCQTNTNTNTESWSQPFPSGANFFNATYCDPLSTTTCNPAPTTNYSLDMHLDQSQLDFYSLSPGPSNPHILSSSQTHEFRESDWVDLTDDYAALSPLPIFSLTESVDGYGDGDGDGSGMSGSSSSSSSQYSTPAPATPVRLPSPLNLPGSPALRSCSTAVGVATGVVGYGMGEEKWMVGRGYV